MSALCKGGDGLCTSQAEADGYCDAHHLGPQVTLPSVSDVYDERVLALAKKNGCDPVWRDGIVGWAWHCTCDDLQHADNSQCSAISISSAQRVKL